MRSTARIADLGRGHDGVMADWVHAIEHGWVIVDNPPGPDVDEFADAEQVSTALSTAADSGLLAVQHPHRTPAAIAAGLTLRQAIPRAVSTLDSIKAAHYRPATDVVAIYRVSGFDGTAIGLLGMVDPDVAGGDGLRSSEDVYPAVVAERAEVLAGLRCATSAAMLVPTDDGGRLTDELSVARQRLGAPDVSTVDAFGRRHELWLVFAGELRDRLLAVAGAADLLVADGNHRVAATRAAGASGLYALITAGPRLRVGSIHRVLVGTGLTVDDLESAWHAVGLAVHRLDASIDGGHGETSAKPGRVIVRAPGGVLAVDLPPAADDGAPAIDHEIVERVLISSALGIDPAGDRVLTLPETVARQQDRRPDEVRLMIAPVTFDDVLAMHRAGRRMPRKSTYFTPKPRSGLLLADLDLAG